MTKYIVAAFILLLACSEWNEAHATNCAALPYTLTNGQIADANQVMANFNALLTCANNDLAGVPVSISQGGTSATDSATALANLGGTGAIATLGGLRAAATPSGAVIYLEGTTNPGDGIQGFFLWNAASTCTDDSGQTCVKPTSVSGAGRWVRDPPGWYEGGITNTGGELLTGSIGSSTVNGNTIWRTDAQLELHNTGVAGNHGLISLVNLYQPCSGTPVATFTGSISTNQLTSSVGTLTTGDIICGSMGSYGTVANGTTIVSGSSSPYTLNNSQSVGGQTMYEYPSPEEASYSTFGYDGGANPIETASINTTWVLNNNNVTNGLAALNLCPLGYVSSTLTEACTGDFTLNSVLLDYEGGNNNVPTVTAHTTEVYENFLVRGASTIGNAAATPQLAVGNSSGYSTIIEAIRPSTSYAADYELYTGSTRNFGMGTGSGTGTSDFAIYDYVNSRIALNIDASSDLATFGYGVSAASVKVTGITSNSGGHTVCVTGAGLLYTNGGSSC